jgi:hypothetical protein
MPVSKGNRHTDHRVFSVQHEDGELQGNNPNTETLTKLFGRLQRPRVSEPVYAAMCDTVGSESIFWLISAPDVPQGIGHFANGGASLQRVAHRVEQIAITGRRIANDLE